MVRANPVAASAKGGINMKLSIDIDDAELNEVITNGIKGLSTETITDLAKEALKS